MLRNNALQFCKAVLALGIFLATGTTLAQAGIFTAYGPQDYARGTGAPVTVANSFSVLNPNTQYTLKAFNGGLQDDQTELVSSGFVILNGVQILGPNNFNQNVAEVDVPVTLQTSNTLSVQIRGKPGGVLTIQIIGVDNDPPTISATVSPTPNAAGWNHTNVTVTFTCGDATSGVATCPPPQTLTNDGANQVISGTATDKAGNSASTSATVNLDKTPPTITATASPAANPAGWNNTPVTVTFSCGDATSGIASCPQTQTVTIDGGNQAISGTATDVAGNTANAAITVNLDQTPPTITALVSPAPNAAGWNNTNPTVTFNCSDSTSGVANCPTAQTVSIEEANQLVTGTAIDVAGNTANASVTINLDKTPPTVTIASPPNGSTISLSTIAIGLNGSEKDGLSGVSTVTCNGSSAVISGSNFTCTVLLTQGSNSISVQATDVAGNTSSSPLSLTFAPAPQLAISSPANLSITNITPAIVRGTVSDPAAVVTVNGIPAPQSGGGFAIPVPLTEGLNVLTAVATNASGVVSTATSQVTLDTTPPHITIDTPADGTVTTDASVTVIGLANDVVVGTVNAQDVQVTVNGIAAQVANRTYAAANVPLTLGANTIQASARDRAGNGTTVSVAVTRVPPALPPPPPIGQAVITQSLNIVSGNNQTGTIGSQLPAPLVVALMDSLGHPVVNQTVVFKVTGSDGTVSTGLSGTPATGAMVATDANGQAQALWTLSQRSGAGINALQASSPLAVSPVNFSASGVTANAATIVVDSGTDQTGVLGQPLGFPFVAAVVDAGHNRVPNVPVTFTVKQGDGSIAGASSQTVTTDSNGRAIVVLTLGVQIGNENNVVEAAFPNNPGLPAVFAASARAPGNSANTTISGIVLDNSNNPIQGATIRLFQTNQGNNNNLPMQIGTPVQTDAKGTFLIQPAPVGFFKLMADGTTASGPNTYPTLEYDIVTIAGNNNTVGMPIYLPALDTTHKLCVDETHGGTLTLPQVPGFSLTVLPGSATFPGGSRTGCVSVTPVNGDKVPMPPGFGQQPRFIVTIQPVGTSFNPPAPITLPNVDGLAARAVTEMYSYDHDLSMFVAIGTGTVSADGSVIKSNPGVGVLKAGWHCGGNPNQPGSGEVVHVKITTPAPVVVGRGGTTTITSDGGPLPGTFQWKTSDPTIVALQGSSTNSSVQIQGVAQGTATLTVRFTCHSVDQNGVHPFAEATINVKVVDVKLIEVGWGNGNHTMMKDGTDSYTNDKFGVEGDTTIVNPIWIANADGTIQKNDPAAYTKGSSPTLVQVKLGITPTADAAVAAKLKVQSVSGALKFQPADISLSGDSITIATLTTTNTVGDTVDNALYELHWSISFDGGTTYREFAVSTHQIFVTFGTPAGFLANPGVTAKRIDRATRIAAGESAPVTIAQKMSQAVRTDVGFDLNKFIIDDTGNHWAVLDPPITSCDCISLAVLTAKHLRMIGITASGGRAFPTGGNPPGNTDAGDSETTTIGGVPVILGFFAAGGFNRFEGFFEISDAGTRKAFTVDPVQGPILETTLPVAGDKLQYNVIKTSLTLIQGGGGNNGKQFWFKRSDFTILDPTSPIPFP